MQFELSKKGKGRFAAQSLQQMMALQQNIFLGQVVIMEDLILNNDAPVKARGMVRHYRCWFIGGPGRAGGGEEMGGIRGVEHYMQRVALQGSPTSITAVTGILPAHAKQPEED